VDNHTSRTFRWSQRRHTEALDGHVNWTSPPSGISPPSHWAWWILSFQRYSLISLMYPVLTNWCANWCTSYDAKCPGATQCCCKHINIDIVSNGGTSTFPSSSGHKKKETVCSVPLFQLQAQGFLLQSRWSPILCKGTMRT
jgi:hypothetical protein